MFIHVAPVKFSTGEFFRANRAINGENHMLDLDVPRNICFLVVNVGAAKTFPNPSTRFRDNHAHFTFNFCINLSEVKF